jgi:hypothetical protein
MPIMAADQAPLSVTGLFTTWLGRQDSNLRMPGSKPGALPLGDAPTKPLHFNQCRKRPDFWGGRMTPGLLPFALRASGCAAVPIRSRRIWSNLRMPGSKPGALPLGDAPTKPLHFNQCRKRPDFWGGRMTPGLLPFALRASGCAAVPIRSRRIWSNLRMPGSKPGALPLGDAPTKPLHFNQCRKRPDFWGGRMTPGLLPFALRASGCAAVPIRSRRIWSNLRMPGSKPGALPLGDAPTAHRNFRPDPLLNGPTVQDSCRA